MDQPSLPGIPSLPPFATSNPKEIRIICALANGPCSREDLDRVAGISNAPDAILKLRDAGLTIPCERLPTTDRDGGTVHRGRYQFTADDRERTMHIWGRLP
nr:hypothetical protein [Dechloromonas sp.]